MSKDGYTALLGASTEYSGRLSFKGTVRIDGRFTGDIVSEGKLVLGKDAIVDGSVQVSELIVHGTLNGEVVVITRTILHQTARVKANLITARLIMEEGAELQGVLQMGASVQEAIVVEHKALPKPAKNILPEEAVKQ